MLYGCPTDPDRNPEYKITLNNKSNLDILFCEKGIYPDTSLYELGFNNNNINYYCVNAETSKVFWYSSMTFKQDRKTCFFILDKNLINTIPWDTVRNKYMILKRDDLSLKQLEIGRAHV